MRVSIRILLNAATQFKALKRLSIRGLVSRGTVANDHAFRRSDRRSKN